MINFHNLFIQKLKTLYKNSKIKKNYFILNSSNNDDKLENKIYDIVKKRLNINE